jgi:hypothetical protein
MEAWGGLRADRGNAIYSKKYSACEVFKKIDGHKGPLDEFRIPNPIQVPAIAIVGVERKRCPNSASVEIWLVQIDWIAPARLVAGSIFEDKDEDQTGQADEERSVREEYVAHRLALDVPPMIPLPPSIRGS